MALTTIAEVKTYLGISGTDDDTLLTRLVSAAQDKIEEFCNRKFDSATFTEYHDGNDQPHIILRNTPVTSITSVSLRATATTYTAISSSTYDSNENTGEVFLLTGSSALWALGLSPGRRPVFPKGRKSVQVVYVGGYSSIPAGLEQGCIELVARMYGGGSETRQTQANGIVSESLGYESRTFGNQAEEFDWMVSRFGAWRSTYL